MLRALFRLLWSFELAFKPEGAVKAALAQSKAGSADVADGLHVALVQQANREPLWTFDDAIVAGIDFFRGTLWVEAVLTHNQYDKEAWK